jgi:ATP-dependent RNA helicase RhlE
LPNIPEDYVHRIGRTGRAGASGEALSLVSADETSFLRGIEKLIEMKLPVQIIEGFEPDPNASTAPIKQGQGRQNRNSRNSGNSNRNSKGNTNSRRPKRSNDRRN